MLFLILISIVLMCAAGMAFSFFGAFVDSEDYKSAKPIVWLASVFGVLSLCFAYAAGSVS